MCEQIKAVEFDVLVRISHELAPNFETILGGGFSVYSNSVEGLAEEADHSAMLKSLLLWDI